MKIGHDSCFEIIEYYFICIYENLKKSKPYKLQTLNS